MIACGMMSGTSLDGVDVAIIETDGVNIQRVIETGYIPYPKDFKKRLKAALGTQILNEDIVALTKKLMDYHAEAFLNLKHHKDVEVVGVHGQTIFHQPKQGFLNAKTWQIVDAEYLQSLIHKTIVYDFRSEDIRQGGEGAPLVPIYHHALFKGHTFPVSIVNIGGVANMTWIESDSPEHMRAGDTGPGNALMNDFFNKRTGESHDENGHLASKGKAHQDLVNIWLTHPYFQRSFPKSLDRDTFSHVQRDLISLTTEDGLATLLEFTVQSILKSLPGSPQKMYICGGGRHNTFLLKTLQKHASFPILPMEDAGFNADFIEAEAFAFLSVRVIKNLNTSFPKTTGVKHPTCGGEILRLD